MKEAPETKKPKQYNVEPDRALKTWEKWITIRKEETEKLGKLTKRPTVDLVMNLLVNKREDVERKSVLAQAQIEAKLFILRGGPWVQTQRLRTRYPEEPIYERVTTRLELGIPKTIEHIGIPNYIQNTEMGIVGVPERLQCDVLDYDYHTYRNKRELEFKERMEKIDPFRPEKGNLMIRGNRPKPSLPKTRDGDPHTPTISVDQVYNATEIISGIYAVRVNNTVLFKDVPGQNYSRLKKMQSKSGHEDCTTWNYYFSVAVKRAGRGKIYLQNLGTVTLRYCWKMIKKPIPFIPEETYDQVFFFNKNEDVLSPGQETYISITFVSDKPGIYSEYWELRFLNICFFNTMTTKILFNFYADSVDDLEKSKSIVSALILDIHVKSIENIIRDLIDDAVDKSTVIEPQIYPYKKYFLEAEYFVMKNPVCYYHQTEVMHMNEVFKEMSPHKEWDLSIGTWRALMMTKQYDERMMYYEQLRKSHDDLLKPWYEGEDLLKSKFRAMEQILGQLADKFNKEEIRITQNYIPNDDSSITSETKGSGMIDTQYVRAAITDPLTAATINNVFYMTMYEHVATAMETCAGVLSSLDLNRWIQFDFSRLY